MNILTREQRLILAEVTHSALHLARSALAYADHSGLEAQHPTRVVLAEAVASLEKAEMLATHPVVPT